MHEDTERQLVRLRERAEHAMNKDDVYLREEAEAQVHRLQTTLANVAVACENALDDASICHFANRLLKIIEEGKQK